MSLVPTPWPWLKAFDVFPGYVYAAALGITVIGGGAALAFEEFRLGLKDVQIATGEKRIAQLNEAAEHDRAERLQLVAAHNLEIANLQAAHAKQQQENVDAFQREKQSLALRYQRELAQSRSVHDAAAEQAARDRAAASHDLAACQRVVDQHAAFYDVLAEGYDLVVESRKVIGDRDAEVAVLKQTIENDRAHICPSN